MMRRTSRVEKQAVELLADGRIMCKYDLVALVHCDQRTAQRILARIHGKKIARVAKWVSIYRHWIPVYKLGNGTDCPKPKALTSAERAARRRKDLEVRWEEMMQQRLKRMREKSEREAPITITRVWQNV
jgi:hypothetical protein